MALARDIEHNADMVPGKARLIVEKTGHDTVALAQAGAPVDTGYLKNSISVDFDGLGFEAGPTAEYGAYVEEGTDPHDIPDAFGWGITVHHPGTPAEPYMGPAADVTIPRALEAFGHLGGQALDG
jgi:hypothetical protein